MHDCDAWKKYPQHRKWFNKLYVAEIFGYDCGPSGISPSRSGEKEKIDKFESLGYEFVSSYEDADGFLETPRLGFMTKNY